MRKTISKADGPPCLTPLEQDFPRSSIKDRIAFGEKKKKKKYGYVDYQLSMPIDRDVIKWEILRIRLVESTWLKSNSRQSGCWEFKEVSHRFSPILLFDQVRKHLPSQ
ncbi:hypothetical protein NPIL_654291 [Nephila pilipes]|uniref:Uncharacterized protein n=1 Tax=Nephila pilipes TaxID=299642 RepID=A0A8X6NEL7_NEPPI|nr:hypothetical protein NPIL_654291 [Nephila pilipes]